MSHAFPRFQEQGASAESCAASESRPNGIATAHNEGVVQRQGHKHSKPLVDYDIVPRCHGVESRFRICARTGGALDEASSPSCLGYDWNRCCCTIVVGHAVIFQLHGPFCTIPTI